MLEQVKTFIDEHNLISEGTKQINIAVSGGIDSCVLLHILNRLKADYNFRIEILHFNHNQRGTESQEDNAFVFDLAKQFKVKFHAARMSRSIPNANENILREERYKYFASILKNTKQTLIATGHNRDDNIETFIMRLGRGSRFKGLQSIAPSRGQFIRPLLCVSRIQIEEYAAANNILYREDKSNRDNRFTRNKIRNQILPYLEQNLDPQLRTNLNNVITDLTRHYQIYSDILARIIKATTSNTSHGVALNRKRYAVHPAPIRRGLLEYCISSVIPLNYSLSERNFRSWDDFLKTAQSGKRKDFLESGMASADRSTIIFTRHSKEDGKQYSLTPGAKIIIKNTYAMSMTEVQTEDVSFSSKGNMEYVDADKTGPRLIVRNWQKGDWFRPLGMSRRRKVSDFFTDLKLSTLTKKQIPIVCKDEMIVWVAGYRLADSFKVTSRTKHCYKLECKTL